MPSIPVHYNKCQSCGQTWSVQLSPQTDVIRLGREHFTCKCGIAWETGHFEWAHLTPAQRRSYFFSTAEIGVLLLGPFTGALFTFFIARNRWLGLLWGLLGGFVVAALAATFMWTLKYIFIRLSLRRCPFDPNAIPLVYGFLDQMREPSGALAEPSPEETLAGQLREVPGWAWILPVVAAASWFRIEMLWPVMLISLFAFARILLKMAYSPKAPSRR